MQRLFPENTFVAPEIGSGPILIVAEAPGAQEAEQGRPLVGPTGGWLRGRYDEERHGWTGGLLGRAGIRDSDCSRLNVIQCRPPNNLFPTDPAAKSYIRIEEAREAVQHCLDAHVRPVLHARDWKRIILLGEKALRYLTGKTEGIGTWRGSPLALEGSEEIQCVATFHPAWVARSQSDIPVVVSDLKKSLVIPPEFYVTHATLPELRAFDAERFAFDIESNRATGEITMVGLCSKRFHALSVPFAGAYIEELKRIFLKATDVVGHNCIQFDLPKLRDFGVRLSRDCTVYDTMLLQHLLQPDLPHGLGFVGSIFTNKPAWKHLSGDDESLYNCRDTDVTWQAFEQLKPLIVSQQLDELYENVQVPLARICGLMHETGIMLDPSRIGAVREKLQTEMSSDETKLPDILRTHDVCVNRRVAAAPGTLSAKTGKPIKFTTEVASETLVPWRSPTAVAAYLYETLKLPPQLHPKTQKVSTAKGALDWLIRRAAKGSLRTSGGEHVPPGLLAELTALRRLRISDELITTFCQEKYLAAQRLHPSFNVHGTASGRLSSSDPNLQNIPPAAKFIYVPSHPDWSFLEVDWSSLENRLTAWFAGDTERLARLSQAGFNEHKWVASQLFGLAYEDVEKDNSKDAPYGIAKRIGHGSNYGMGPRKIANLFDMDFGEVRKFSAKWKELFVRTVRWQENCGKEAKERGFLTTPFGRKRWFCTDSYYTEALSFLPQSTGADICYRTMIALMYERIGWPFERVEKLVRVSGPLPEPCQLLVQVHDSLLLEGPATQLEEAARLIAEVAQQPWKELREFSIPIEMKLGAPGASWGELEAH